MPPNLLLYPELKLAAGNNNRAGYQSIELITKAAPLVTPVTRPPVVTELMNASIRRDGFLNATWRWAILLSSYLDTIVSTYLTNWSNDDALVTIRTMVKTTSGMGYANYNATMYLPTFEGEDEYGGFEQPTTTKLQNVRITFANLELIA